VRSWSPSISAASPKLIKEMAVPCASRVLLRRKPRALWPICASISNPRAKFGVKSNRSSRRGHQARP
jgi:hypothetical protein